MDLVPKSSYHIRRDILNGGHPWVEVGRGGNARLFESRRSAGSGAASRTRRGRYGNAWHRGTAAGCAARGTTTAGGDEANGGHRPAPVCRLSSPGSWSGLLSHDRRTHPPFGHRLRHAFGSWSSQTPRLPCDSSPAPGSETPLLGGERGLERPPSDRRIYSPDTGSFGHRFGHVRGRSSPRLWRE